MRIEIEGVNPKAALEWLSALDEIPLDLQSKVSDLSTRNPVSNLKMKYLFFTNSLLFSPAAQSFSESCKYKHQTPSYTPYLEGTTAYKKFWQEEKKRCLDGYEPLIDGVPCGISITGKHYFYLNYCRIQKKVELPNGKTSKTEDFPDFLSMDYYWFHTVDQTENPVKYGRSKYDKEYLDMSKSRRKGWSYKVGSDAVYIYSFVPDGRVIILSQFGDKGRTTFKMCLAMIDFLNKYTEFRQPHKERRMQKNDCFIASGTEEEIDGVWTYRGIRTQIETISLKDKPDNAAGKTATLLIFEEGGQIEELKAAIEFSEPTVRDGDDITGMIIVLGTGGDMEKGAKEFSEIFYAPEEFGFRAFDNIYEEAEVSGKCGYFVSDLWFRPGELVHEKKTYEAVDSNGNAHMWVAEISLDKERERKKKGDRNTYATFLTQRCKTPSEAFLVIQGNVFPVADLQGILSKRVSGKEFDLLGRHGELIEVGGMVSFKPDMGFRLNPIDDYPLPHSYKDRQGCVTLFESPREIAGLIQPGAYMVSMDPIDIDNDGGESLCCIVVLKTMKYAPLIGGDEIVCMYIGRPKEDTADECNRIALKMCKFYNAKLSHENDRGGKVVYDFFIKNNCHHFLMKPPARVLKGEIQNSKTLLRKSGHSMSSEQMKELGEIYLKRWLLKIRNPGELKLIRNMDLIPTKRLLKELIMYNRKGNFDSVMALMGGVLQLQELFNEFIEENSDAVKRDSIGQKFNKKINNYYNRNAN